MTTTIAEMTDEQYSTYSEACTRIQPVHALNYAAHEEMLKAFDMIEELNRSRFVSRNIKYCERYWEQYHCYVSERLSDTMFAFLIDYCNEVYKVLEPKIEFLCGSLSEYYGRGQTDNILLSRLVTARMMFVLAQHVHQQIIDFYNTKGMDFGKMFSYVSMASITNEINRIIARMFPRKQTFGLTDTTCVNAYSAILDAIEKNGLFDEAQKNAVDKNRELSMARNIETLSKNFKVTTSNDKKKRNN